MPVRAFPNHFKNNIHNQIFKSSSGTPHFCNAASHNVYYASTERSRAQGLCCLLMIGGQVLSEVLSIAKVSQVCHLDTDQFIPHGRGLNEDHAMWIQNSTPHIQTPPPCLTSRGGEVRNTHPIFLQRACIAIPNQDLCSPLQSQICLYDWT